jgi:hypothetical protein
LPLLERVRVEAYIPDSRSAAYFNLLVSFEEEFTYAFGGCAILRGLDGNYLSSAGAVTQDRINVIFTDLPLAFSTNYQSVARYTDELKQVAVEALAEETVLVAVIQIYHAV